MNTENCLSSLLKRVCQSFGEFCHQIAIQDVFDIIKRGIVQRGQMHVDLLEDSPSSVLFDAETDDKDVTKRKVHINDTTFCKWILQNLSIMTIVIIFIITMLAPCGEEDCGPPVCPQYITSHGGGGRREDCEQVNGRGQPAKTCKDGSAHANNPCCSGKNGGETCQLPFLL